MLNASPFLYDILPQPVITVQMSPSIEHEGVVIQVQVLEILCKITQSSFWVSLREMTHQTNPCPTPTPPTSKRTLQLASVVLLLLLLCEGLLQPADLLLILGSRAPPVLQLRSHTAQVLLQGGNVPLPFRRGCLHGMPQDENLTVETRYIDQIY